MGGIYREAKAPSFFFLRLTTMKYPATTIMMKRTPATAPPMAAEVPDEDGVDPPEVELPGELGSLLDV